MPEIRGLITFFILKLILERKGDEKGGVGRGARGGEREIEREGKGNGNRETSISWSTY